MEMKRTYFNINFKALSFRSLPGYRQRAAKQHSCQALPIPKKKRPAKISILKAKENYVHLPINQNKTDCNNGRTTIERT